MINLAERESNKYRTIWGDKQYRVVSPGMRHLESAIDWMQPEVGSSFTDWGCGTGRASEELASRGFSVRLVDIAPNAYLGDMAFTEACLWQLPSDMGPTDYGFCADVMEHIPPEHIDDVFAGIASRTAKKCYFQIALFHDSHFTQAGPLHLTVHPSEWWQSKIGKHFSVSEFRKVRLKHLLAVVSP